MCVLILILYCAPHVLRMTSVEDDRDREGWGEASSPPLLFHFMHVLPSAGLPAEVPFPFPPGPPPLVGSPNRVPIVPSTVLSSPFPLSPLRPLPLLVGLADQGSCWFSSTSTFCIPCSAIVILTLLYLHVLIMLIYDIILIYAKCGFEVLGCDWPALGPDVT